MVNKKIAINVVHGTEGDSLQLVNKAGCGVRIAGPKAWGNPYNKPFASFEVSAEELINYIEKFQYEFSNLI